MAVDVLLVYERKGNVFKDNLESSLYQISIINKIPCPFLKKLTTSCFFYFLFKTMKPKALYKTQKLR